MDCNASLHSSVPTTLLAYVCPAQKGVGSKNQIKIDDKILFFYQLHSNKFITNNSKMGLRIMQNTWNVFQVLERNGVF